jgi:hypothetical protein
VGDRFRFGRLAAACAIAVCFGAQARAEGGAFSIAVLPDTQNMVDYRHQEVEGFPFDASELFLGEMRWIADHAQGHGGDIAFVAAVGDVWQHQTLAIDPAHERRGFKRIENPWFATELEITPKTRTVETVTALQGYALLAKAGLAFGVAPGNHDYDAMWSDSRFPPVTDAKKIDMTPKTLGMLHIGGLDNFRSVFQAKRYADRPWYVASYTGGTSSAQVFQAGGYTFLHLALEMSPSDAALKWASSVIQKYPGVPTIVTTHDYLNAKGERKANPIIDLAALDPIHNSAEDLWREFLSQHDQIFLVLCGHHHGVATRTDKNAKGHEVLQLLADYQDRGQASLDANVPLVRGQPVPIGDGWLRLLSFDTQPAVPTLRVRTWSPHYKAYADELATYAKWYKAHESPELDDAAFVKKDAFSVNLSDFRARFGAPH